MNAHRSLRVVANAALLSASCLAIAVGSADRLHAQAAPPTAQPAPAQLPAVDVQEPKRTPARRARNEPGRRTEATARRPAAQPAPQAPPPTPVANPANTFDARTGSVGVYSNSTAVATKTNTPLVNIPQSVSVITKDFIRDQNFQQLTDVTRYVPGVAIHQGEGNRDELVIRGVDSSANFFVNGFRDDVQIFRDLYNAQSIEVLKGTTMLTFGRGAGGGVVNRTLKDADGQRIYEGTLQTGSYQDRRVTLDAGQAVNANVAARLNVMYEAGDTFRNYADFQRWGINPTMTFAPNDTTRIKLSFETYHDNRTADRGNPSIGTGTITNPTQPFAPGGDLTKFFGSPTLSRATADVNTGMLFIEHDFENGLTVKNGTLAADYKKLYQNIYPGSSVNPTTGVFNFSAYNHETDRQNVFNQTDFVYKTFTGPLFHTLGLGTELGHQSGIDYRNTGLFPGNNAANCTAGECNVLPFSAFTSTYFGPVDFVHHPVGGNALRDGVANPDSNTNYNANIQSAYVRDTIEVTRWLQLIGGLRFDRFDLSVLDKNTNINLARVDNLVSPQAAVVLKPRDNLSFYGVYAISYLPASGDQFSAFNNGTVLLDPQKFENKEVGAKWNILPHLLYTAAVFQLDRSNTPLADPLNVGFSVLTNTRVRGFENELTGYITDAWQAKLGYAYTDARITANPRAGFGPGTSNILVGNRVQLVPLDQFSLWNKYQFDPLWSAAVGLIYFSSSFTSSDDLVRMPGFFRVDAAVYRKIDERWRVQINVENVFNKGYWASADGDNNISPGQPRTFRVLAIAKF
jgi:catecholate siderophore receptor